MLVYDASIAFEAGYRLEYKEERTALRRLTSTGRVGGGGGRGPLHDGQAGGDGGMTLSGKMPLPVSRKRASLMDAAR